MWPWGHLAVGYLALALLVDPRLRRPPGDGAALVLAAATQLPDVVDKSLAWYAGLVPSGRSLAHSVLVATLAVAVVGTYLRSRGRDDVAVAFGVGYYAHLAGDAVRPLVAGRWADLAFLGWPLLPAAGSGGPDSVVRRFADLLAGLAAGEVPAFFAVEAGLVVLAAVLWAAQGRPGLGAVGRVRSSRRRSSE